MANPNRYRCTVCGTRRTDWAFMVKHSQKCRPEVCTCGGYPYPHKPVLSACCEKNPMAIIGQAERAGATPEQLEDLRMDMALQGVGKNTTTCPF